MEIKTKFNPGEKVSIVKNNKIQDAIITTFTCYISESDNKLYVTYYCKLDDNTVDMVSEDKIIIK